MVRYSIRVNIGDANVTNIFQFVHKDCATLSKEEQDAAFDKAVKEIDHIYKTYGRFATKNAVLSLFHNFGFELSYR